MNTTVCEDNRMAVDPVKTYLMDTAGLDDVESQSFCQGISRLIEEGRTFTAWEASRAAIASLIAGHPGLRHEQTRDVVHALLAPHLASGAYRVDPVHIGPGREPLLYYPGEAGLHGWLADHPGSWLLREGPPQPDLISLKEAAEMVGICQQNAKRKAKKHGLLQYIGGHPFVSRSGWYELNGIDTNNPQGAHTKSKRLPDSLDIEDCIEDYFNEHPGRHFSATELLAIVRKKYPNVDMATLTDVLREAQSRGDFDQDVFGKWFRPQPEE